MSDYEPVKPVPPREQLAEAYQLLVRAKHLMEQAEGNQKLITRVAVVVREMERTKRMG